MYKHFFALLTVIFAMLACSWTDFSPQAAPVIEPSPLPTFAISTLTAIPTATALPVPTSTPDVAIAWPKDLGANCRFGPGEEWEAISSLPTLANAEIVGRTIDTSWWYISDPMNPGNSCWVSFDVVETAGNLNTVKIVESPTASITSVIVDSSVAFTACGDSNAVSFNGTVKVNGPTAVTYHWEVSGDAQLATTAETLEFQKSGNRELIYDAFSADCGNYTVKLVVDSPNQKSAEKTFTIESP